MALLHTLHYNWDNFDGEAAFRWGIPMGSLNSYVDNRIVNGRKSVMVWVRRMGGALVHLFSTWYSISVYDLDDFYERRFGSPVTI